MSLSFLLDSFLIQAASGPNVFTYFAQSNFAGKVVIFILGVCSIIAWTVMLGKYLDLSKLRSQNQRYERLLSKESHLLALDPERPGKGSGPYYNIVREAIEAFYRYG
ncbi:MAG: flagellar motor protein MotA, partial [Opitutales bacterium]